VLFRSLDVIAAKTKFPRVNMRDGFAENYEPYEAERTAVSNVMRQYLAPIQAGFVPDVEAAIAEFLQLAENAGLSKIREDWKVQWAAYCDVNGYK
jgi:putative aldouronate transport system substrate-binding protein